MRTITGQEAGNIEIDDALLEREKGEQAVHDTVVAYLASKRAGTACTKTRGKVRGGGAKPYRQKGTGHARAGSNRSPIWRGGGTIFGPVPRSYAKKVNKKAKQLAMRRAWTERIDAGDVIVVDKIELAEAKTKEVLKVLNAVEAGENVLILDGAIDESLKLAARNLPKAEAVSSANVNVYQMLLHRKIVITSAGVDVLGERLR
jgi:large subunit ribosomal protein L4